MGSLMRFNLDDFLLKYKVKTFIETGSARGDSIAYAATRPEFQQLLSCEIEPLLAINCIARFNYDPRISIVRMESVRFIHLVASSSLPPALFWLDAHYPGAGFGLGEYDAAMPDAERLPLHHELQQIAAQRDGRDVILIDDLRIYESGPWEDGPLPSDVPGAPVAGGADWIRAMFAETHKPITIERDQGYLLLVPLAV